jgi:hypothetical protein
LLKGQVEELLTQRIKPDFVRVVGKPEVIQMAPSVSVTISRLLSSDWSVNAGAFELSR